MIRFYSASMWSPTNTYEIYLELIPVGDSMTFKVIVSPYDGSSTATATWSLANGYLVWGTYDTLQVPKYVREFIVKELRKHAKIIQDNIEALQNIDPSQFKEVG